jgi:hypothetical protein
MDPTVGTVTDIEDTAVKSPHEGDAPGEEVDHKHTNN